MRAAAFLPLALLACLLAAHSAAAQEPAAPAAIKPLTVEEIFAHGPLIGTPPSGISWSPDGNHLTYLDGGELVDLDPDTGKQHVMVSRAKLASISGASASEVDRDHRDRYKMASYLWAPDSGHLLFDSNGRLWLYDLRNGTGIEVGFTGAASGDDPKFSPNGEYLSFIRDHGLSVLHLRDPGSPTITAAPAPIPDQHTLILNGEVDWVYEEELDVRSNYFWSPDSKSLAFLQMNESEVPSYPLTDWIPTHATVDLQRYPQPGDPNPDVRVGVVGASGGKTVWVKLPIHGGQDYIPRFGWVDRKTLWIETVTRDHKQRALYFADAASGDVRLALQISDDKFLDENYDVSVGFGTIVLTNWTDGHNHLYLYSYNESDPSTAKLERQLTKGGFEVEEVLRVDHQAKVVDYDSNEDNPLERELWQVTFDGNKKQLTAEPGYHTGNFAPSGDAFVDTRNAQLDPPIASICRSAGKCNVFWQTRALEPYHLRAPQPLEIKAHDGSTLYATLLLPEGAASTPSVPLIVNPYGGPGPGSVLNRWGGDSFLFDELLVQHGYAVLHADNRGTGGRGRDFAQAAYHNFGPIQLEDQLTVLDAVLAQYPQLDGKRLGFWGWSWGGTFTLYALSHSDRFRAGVAVAPVTDWRNYDSIYTERYMSQPAEFPAGYKDFSVVNSAANLKGRLLLVQGTGDDNVHIGNTIQFVQQLIEAEIPYDLQIYPRKTHSIAGPDVRTHLFNRILAHFEEYLKTSASAPVAP
jgi:dipeptidyl-peptidase-4